MARAVGGAMIRGTMEPAMPAADLGFSDAVYGLGAGIFFIGYFLFEVPSNMLLERRVLG